jgi:hypothetical protein
MPENVIPLDHILDDVMLYWLPNAGASSARLYWENAQASGAMPHDAVPLPAGLSVFPGEALRLSRRWAEKRFADLRYYAQPSSGGHFAAMENPAALVHDVRATVAAIV